jgi:signal transduction histidine kinase
LVYELIKLHSGSVSVNSETGQGTIFTVRLPLGKEHLPQERVVAERPLLAPVATARAYVQEALRWLPDSNSTPARPELDLTSVSERLRLVGSGLARARVLVADDNADMRSYVRELLEPRYEVAVVPDGEAALESARRSPPDLIVSDVMMPRMDGFELVRKLRAEPQLREVPTILLSARAGEESVIEGLQAMADDYLVKPFAARELLARVAGQLQLARLRRDARAREQALRHEAEVLLNEALQARIALETADRQKNEFLAMLAHELRNPLAPIRNAGEILSRTLPPSSPTHAAIAMVKRQVMQLTRLVDDLLDVSRITQGRVELKREPLDLATVISLAVETVEPLFREREHEVSIVSSYRALYVNADVTRLVQSIVNILTNAAKYTDAGGKIELQTRADGDYALVEVSDNGTGIPAELLPRVFELFVQGDRTLDRSLGGLGIGLSVAKQLIEMHGGKVTAVSPGLGRGSTFRVWLPLIERPGSLLGERPAPQPLSRRVLIIDDNVDAADSLALVLELDGHVTKTGYSAQEALEQAVAFEPDVILLDIGLPEMDGYEVARRLRALGRAEGVKLIALTGYGQVEDLRRAHEAGFDNHLVKPVDFESLTRCLAGLPGGAFSRRVS